MRHSSTLAIASPVEPRRQEAQAVFVQGRISCGHKRRNPAWDRAAVTPVRQALSGARTGSPAPDHL